MKIKIDAVDGINLNTQLQIVKDYIENENDNGTPKITGKDWGTKIESCGRRYHVKCHKTRTMWVFTIWWGI
jgi:hypothetical protein